MTTGTFDPIASLRAAHGGIAAELAVDQRVDALREELAALGVDMTPPVDPGTIAAALGIEVHRVAAAEVGFDAALVETDDGRFSVLVNAASGSPARQRFTLAHEIVHTLVPADPGRPRFRRPEQRRRPDAAVERLIDRGAARLLMPPDQFRGDLDRAGLTPSGLLELADRYAVSREAAAVQAVIHWTRPAAVVFCEYAYRPSTPESSPGFERKAWRVQRGFASEGFPMYPHRGMAFPEGSAIDRAAVSGREITRVESLMSGRGNPVKVRIAARPLSRNVVPPPRVLGVLESVDDEHQE